MQRAVGNDPSAVNHMLPNHHRETTNCGDKVSISFSSYFHEKSFKIAIGGGEPIVVVFVVWTTGITYHTGFSRCRIGMAQRWGRDYQQ